jgi:hypothetical protein
MATSSQPPPLSLSTLLKGVSSTIPDIGLGANQQLQPTQRHKVSGFGSRFPFPTIA